MGRPTYGVKTPQGWDHVSGVRWTRDYGDGVQARIYRGHNNATGLIEWELAVRIEGKLVAIEHTGQDLASAFELGDEIAEQQLGGES